MALEIVWTKKAKEGYHEILDYLIKHWTDKEIKSFIKQVNDFLLLLEKSPKILEASGTMPHIYRGPINRLTILTYQYLPRNNRIVLLNIRSARQKGN